MIQRFGHLATINGRNLWRGAQPLPEGFATLAALDVATIFSIGTRNLKAPAGSRPFRVVHAPARRLDLALTQRIITALRDALTRGSNLYLCCPDGRTHSGAIAACWRILVDDWEFDSADAERRAYGMAFVSPDDNEWTMSLLEDADDARRSAMIRVKPSVTTRTERN